MTEFEEFHRQVLHELDEIGRDMARMCDAAIRLQLACLPPGKASAGQSHADVRRRRFRVITGGRGS